jgi:hypothetical protein
VDAYGRSEDTHRDLQETYQPHNATLVRFAGKAHMRGRAALRGTDVKKNR